MNFIIYDIEATCWEGRPPRMQQETIEIGAVKVNAYGEILGEFSRLIKPVIHPQLSHFCRWLTKIDQADINRSRDFRRVVEDFQDFIGIYDADYALASWGKFDLNQMTRDCDLHRMDDDWLHPHLNLKKQYQDIKGLPKPRGLQSAIKHEGYEFTGEAHRALTDARNTVKIFKHLLDVWVY
ncbi:MAG: 3'-5' exonuclease [Bacteroidota bacterium]